MELVLEAGDGDTYHLALDGERLRCAIGKGGVRLEKREGDGATPVGRFPLRRIFFRKDRLAPPKGCRSPVEIRSDHGWSDDPRDPGNYNRLVTLPYSHSHERMRRDDAVYDVVVELGYNDDPPEPGRGSAIFMHVARPDYSGTEGCIALALPDLLKLLERCGGEAVIVVPPELA